MSQFVSDAPAAAPEPRSRFPLHYQILAAMVVGAAVGLWVNAGERALPDATVRFEPLPEGGIAVTEIGRGGRTVFRQTFPSVAAFEQRFREADDLYPEARRGGPHELPVTERRLHFSEVREEISLRYTRQYGELPMVNSPDVASRAELAQRHPWFLDEYDRYAGTASRSLTIAAKTVGDLFLRLLRMITVPLIVTSLVTGVAGLGSSERVGAMFGKTLLYYLATSFLAITTGLAMVNLIRPGVGANLPGGGEGAVAGEGRSLSGIFVGLVEEMIPPNPVAALAEGDFLAIIVFSILLGLFMIFVGGKSGETLRELFAAGFEVMMAMTVFIIRLAPIGVFAFMLYATASQGLGVFATFGWYLLTVFLALVVHSCFVLPLMLWLVARRSPWQYAKALSPALLTAFSTASSNGTLPLTLTSVERRAGVSNRVSSFVLPLGATINMDGTALYEAVAVLFIAQAYTGGAMSLEQQIIVAVTALLASVGAAGIPSAGLVMMAIVLQAVDLPLDAQGLIIAVDRVLDMCRTAVNVWSDACGCAVIERFEPKPAAVAGVAA
ncbi:MAG: dicarboxylate/amino acid:cation symporter [Planctomycetes bacterium]|nr:dicarboxylate/amino acid:cation symporter [Planctomycetota bacterium]